MNKKYVWISVAFLMVLCVIVRATACKNEDPSENVSQKACQFTAEERAEYVVRDMTAEQKIGQLMMVGMQGTALDHESQYVLKELHCGNVILFDRNMETPDQVKKLTKEVRDTVKNSTGTAPFIGIDQEGGQVLRMQQYLPNAPAAEELGKEDPSETYNWAVKTGKALTELGITLNFAPVVDLGDPYERSYGTTPEAVLPYAEAACRGYAAESVKSTLKHFPGIGKAKTDPHIEKDVISINRTELDQQDGRPFRELIAKLDPYETYIMVSNVTFPSIDPINPACFSRTIMTDILRNDYHYEGLIFTDDMEMGAVARHYTFREAGVKAVEAGADIVLVCQDYGHEKEVYEGLLDAYKDGTLNKEDVDQKVRHIVLAKIRGNLM